MSPELSKRYSQAFHVPERLVRFIPELLADIRALGSAPNLILEWLRELGLPPGTQVLDLACGKGAALITLANELKFNCLGIDFFSPFIDEARRVAEEYGVSDHCTFQTGDIREFVKKTTEFDILLLTSVGSVLGNLEQTIGILRALVKPGGWMVIDDGFLAGDSIEPAPGYEDCLDLDGTRLSIKSCGDTIVKEKIFTQDEMRRMNDRNTSFIAGRVCELSAKYPQYKSDFEAYLRWEMEECKILESDISAGMWLIRKEISGA